MLFRKRKVNTKLIYILYKQHRINIFSKKLIFLSEIEKITNTCLIKIFDLEENRLFTRSCNLRILKTLNGLSQNCCGNTLFLCGSNEEEIENTSGSYLIRFDISNIETQSSILVNSIYPHYKPILIIINSAVILVIGGKRQVLCEKYSISHSKWREMPFLPEERYLGNVLFNEKDFHLYLFGGLTETMFNDSVLILNLRSVGGWDKIFIKENSELLQRVNCVSLYLNDEDDDTIYICGGEGILDQKIDFIVEYDFKKNKLQANEIDVQDVPKFDITTVSDINKNKFAFVDENENIYIIDIIGKDHFKINIFNQEDT